MWEHMGRAMKRAGKAIGNQAMIDKGRHWQYGHLSPTALMREHPSAFLRTYAVRSLVEPSDQPGHHNASTHMRFQLHTVPSDPLFSAGPNTINDGSGAAARTPKAHVHLILQSQKAAFRQNNPDATKLDHTFQAAFLPMRQANQDNVGGLGAHELDPHVQQWRSGAVKDTALAGANENMTLTTHLSGCTIAKRRNSLMHIRPESDGKTMQESLPRQQTFGRLDYGQQQEVFVMTKQKPDGHTRLYFQRQDMNSGELHSGKHDFPTI